MSELEALIEDVQSEFGLFSASQRLGRWNDFYVEMTGRLAEGSLSRDRSDAASRRLASPTAFLGPSARTSEMASGAAVERPRRSFSFVVGEYGLGKTEMLYHLAEVLAKPSAMKDAICLPIRLGSCARHLKELVAVDATPESFLLHLMHHATDQAPEPMVLAQLLKGIRSGAVIMLLDALDELVSDLQEHTRFIEHVRDLIAACAHTNDFHVVISVRLEHLKQVDPEGKDTARLLGVDSVPVNFVMVEFFDDATVSDYIARRIGKEPAGDVSRQLAPHRRLRDVLRRPLFARLFCDLVVDARLTPAERDVVLGRLTKIDSPAELVQLFTEQAVDDRYLSRAHKSLLEAASPGPQAYYWDNERLARESLEAFRHGHFELSMERVRRILGAPDSVDANTLARMAHKCPFLALISRSTSDLPERGSLRAIFTHRVFLEYFVTRGIVDELVSRLSPDDPCDTGDSRSKDFASFHDLVLNLDMHKFLRALTVLSGGTELWYRETRVAYGLEGPGLSEWDPALTKTERDSLDHIRRDLLDARSGLRSDPETDTVLESVRLRRLVEEYLTLEESGEVPSRGLMRQALTPRFQVPNYEAVAVCLWKPEVYSPQLGSRFSKLLRERLLSTESVLRLAGAPTNYYEPYELLVERVLDIGRRFEHEWAAEWTEDMVVSVPSAALARQLVIRSDTGCRERIRFMLKEIQARRMRSADIA